MCSKFPESFETDVIVGFQVTKEYKLWVKLLGTVKHEGTLCLAISRVPVYRYNMIFV